MTTVKSLAERFNYILEKYAPYLDELNNVGVSYKVGFWTPLKLYVVASYIHTCYTKIIHNSLHFLKGIYYIDLLSNSGLNMVHACHACKLCDPQECQTCSKRLKKNEPYRPFPGSPLLAATAEPPFGKMYFIDNDNDKLVALGKRLDFLSQNGLCKSRFKILKGDCNKVVDDVINEIKQNHPYHFLAFADNSGLDVTWATIEKLLDCKYCDLIINYPTSNIKRAFGQRTSDYELTKLHNFFGCNIENEIDDEEKLIDVYIKQIEKKDKKAEKIHITTEIGYCYDILIVTKVNAGFTKYVNNLKEIIEEQSASGVEMAFHILSGKQKTLFGKFS